METKRKILLIEDEPALQEAAKLKLEKAGVDVVPAGSGEEGLEILKTVRPDLVWLDLLLPGMNGLEVLRTIRGDERLKDLPVIIVSVSGGEAKIKQAFSMNVIDYVIKSEYTIDAITAKVKGILDRLTN
ncbi:MAG: response regulator [Candidatus Taylorbacteria bacterium]|nr:response regulator [Candidatus Taylorbacteria bacterium]